MASEQETPSALRYNVLAECSSSKARTATLKVPHYEVETPVFMPVGTQGTMKGLTSKQLTELDCQIILGNTYHLGMRPVSFEISCGGETRAIKEKKKTTENKMKET